MAGPTSGKDNLVGTDGNDYLYGLAGNDTLTGGFGADTLSGDDDNDILYGGANNDYLLGGNGSDRLEGGAGSDYLIGGAGADTVFGGEGDDTVLVAGLADARGDVLDGGTGVDTASFDLASTTTALTFKALNANQKTSFVGATLTGFERFTITAGSGNDSLTGGRFNDVFSGGAGQDTLSGGAGNDSLQGGAGRDTLKGDAGSDYLDGGADDDVLQGGEGNDSLQGGLGNDRIDGGAGNDYVIVVSNGPKGPVEKDVIVGGAGHDTLNLGFGLDTKGLTLDFGTGSFTLAGGTTVSGFEQLSFTGGSGQDKVIGSASFDYLSGGEGNDTLYGRGGNDYITDGQGADGLFGEDGDDTFTMVPNGGFTPGPANFVYDKDAVNGGNGFDTVYFGAPGGAPGTGTAQSVVLDLANQKNNAGFIKGDVYARIEKFVGTTLDDVMRGDGAANTFDGGAGDDVLSGGAGNDVLIGGQGSDTMTGGAGNDVFDLSEYAAQYYPGAPGGFGGGFYGDTKGDVITDFAAGQDKLRLDVRALLEGETAKVTVESGAGSAAKASGPVLHFDTQARELWFDFDGKGTDFDAVHLATITTLATLKASDVLFV
ncbi:calcium-binding protein [Methylorubrum salsuginis]|uniref:Type I secretion C-terminal target domain (VC_A0849 subclass) n=1 Tax=Methylorubrum salsuginis TaxID=414703 RepID=A0A1I4M7S9_9HYPH|nr:calcium-binding protein [Methylorubrum salsuginis]SFL99294.1 type I secretion C-terminal target domain (VC_A0849 subclass) [Methylorubrum salsuginis]